jgi:hypothetical protein
MNENTLNEVTDTTEVSEVSEVDTIDVINTIEDISDELNPPINIIDNELEHIDFNFNISLWYVSLSKYCEQFNIYHCHPNEFYAYDHYLKTTISLLTFNDYETSYNIYIQVNRKINGYKKHLLTLDNQILATKQQYQQELSNMVGFNINV